MEESAQGTIAALEHEPDSIREKATQASKLLQQGKIDDACSLANEAYEEGRSSLGRDHPSTLRARSVAGKATTYQGRFQDGEQIAREVFAKYTELLGEAHVDTLRAKNNLVVSLSYQCKINEAYELVERISRTAGETLGVANEDALWIKCQLMQALMQRGSLQESARLGRELLERAQRVLGQNHLVVISTLTNLCVTLNQLERKDEALVVGSQAVQRSVAEYGNEHLASCKAKIALFAVLFNKGQRDEASKMLAEAGKAIRKNQRPGYPDVFRVDIQWDRVPLHCGEASEATTLILETLKHTRRLQTESNIWETLAMQTLAGLLYRSDGTRTHALPIMDEAIAAQRKFLGSEHDTVRKMEKLLASMEHSRKRCKEGPESLRLFDNLAKNSESYEIVTQVYEAADEPFKPVHDTNADRSKRDVYLKMRPLEVLVDKFQWGRMGELASMPSLAYWALEVRSPEMAAKDEGLTWALLPTANGEMDPRMEFGRWRDAVPTLSTGKKGYLIKSVKQKVGTSRATDVEINDVATQVLETLRDKQASTATLEHVRALRYILSTPTTELETEPALPENSSEAMQQCSFAFKSSQDFVAQIAQRLCPDGFLRRNGARKALDALTTARKKAYVVLETAEPEKMYSLPICSAPAEKKDGQDGVSVISTVLSPTLK